MLKRLYALLCFLCGRMSRLCGAIALAERGDFDRVRELREGVRKEARVAAPPSRRP